ncbi:MAG: hypothetical protein LBU32_07350 [Clostridiales bacterium]|jgi:hypothetical protein|nr:hypothetical protein [Clostridiales bacterium]
MKIATSCGNVSAAEHFKSRQLGIGLESCRIPKLSASERAGGGTQPEGYAPHSAGAGGCNPGPESQARCILLFIKCYFFGALLSIEWCEMPIRHFALAV